MELEMEITEDLARQLAEAARRRRVSQEQVAVEAIRWYVDEWLREYGSARQRDMDGE